MTKFSPNIVRYLSLLICSTFFLNANPFITTWKTTTSNENIVIPINSNYTYNYNIDCDNDGTFEQTNVTGNGTCTFTSMGEHNISIVGTFPAIYINNGASKDKILDVVAWGNIEWKSMYIAFLGASKLEINALDTPNLTAVKDMTGMFYQASTFNQDIGDWNVSSVTTMIAMFYEATSFNQNIGYWDVSSVTNMSSIFSGATSFNQDIGNWDVSSVTDMSYIFLDAISFNQNIGDWNVSSVTTMYDMFNGATSFNQALGDWNVSSVTTMYEMFNGATNFNQELGNWDVSSVRDMRDIFYATSFNQDISNWDVSLVIGFGEMFSGSFSTENYDKLLNKWSLLNLTPNVGLNVGSTKYSSDSEAIRQYIINNFNWTINDGGISGNPFITTWKTTVVNEDIVIPTNSSYTYNYYIDCDNDGTFEQTNVTGNGTCTFASIGEHNISILGAFPVIYINNGVSKDKILDVVAWGEIEWKSMYLSFHGASNLEINALDTPNLTAVKDMTGMFYQASTFNQDIGDWNVSSVTTMIAMFYQATSFNQDIGYWDVSSVTNMSSIFNGATSFNQDIGNWDVSSLTDMSYIFLDAISFNQNIGDWNVSSVTTMYEMFKGATSFNQELGNWNVSAVTDMAYMFHGVSLSTSNYDKLLNGWANLNLQSGLTFDGGNSQYSQDSNTSRQSIIDNFGWSISDGGILGNPFISTWKTTVVNEDIVIPTNASYTYNYNIDCDDDGRFEQTNVTGNGICNFTSIGEHNISILGTFPAIYINGGASKDKILDVVAWGDIEWKSMFFSFSGASNLEIHALDTPNLMAVTNMSGMFVEASSFNQELGDWNVSAVTDMSGMFYQASSFDQNIGNWNVSALTNMDYMFHGVSLSTSNYDKLLNGWANLNLQSGLTFDGGNSLYSKDAMVNRQSIIDNFGWNIIDGGLDATLDDITATEDGSDFNVTLNPTDADFNTITYTATSSNTNMVNVSIVDNILTVTLVGNEYGVVTIEVYGTVNGVTTLETFTLTVSAVNDAPSIDTTFTYLVQIASTSATVTFYVNDPEGDQLDMNVSSSDTSVATATAEWTNSVNYAEYDGVALSFTIQTNSVTVDQSTSITLNVSDGEFSTSESFNVTVTPSSEDNTSSLVPVITYILQ